MRCGGLQLGHSYIGTEHLLLGLCREQEGVAAQVLVKLDADLPKVRQQVTQLLSGYQGGKEAVGVGGGGLVKALKLDQLYWISLAVISRSQRVIISWIRLLAGITKHSA